MSELKNLRYSEHILTSSERTYGTNDRPVWVLDHPLINVKYVKFVKSILSKSYWNIDGISDTLVIQEDTGSAFSVSIANGNYILGADTDGSALASLAGSMMLELESKLTAASAASGNSYTYTTSYNPSTGLLTITASAGTFAILGSNASSTLHLLLGFSAVDTAQASFHAGDLVQRVESFPEYLFVNCNVFASDGISSIDNSSNGNNIAARVDTQLSPGLGGVIVTVNSETQADVFIAPTNISEVVAYCTHSKLNSPKEKQIIQFNGGVWSFVLGYYYYDY